MANIKAPQVGNKLDSDLKEFLDAEDDRNNNKIIYIRHGHFDFDTEENLFSIAQLT